MGEYTEGGVSVITVVLNGETFIEGTIRSVISQQEVPCEYIVIDGGSTDGTLHKIAKYQKHITRLISEPDGGIYQAINKGIALCTRSLIGIIHCGDAYTSGATGKAYRAFRSSGADIVYGDIHLRDEELGDELQIALSADHRHLRRHMSVFHPAVFVSRSCYAELGIYDSRYRLAADYDWLLKASLAGRTFHHVPEVLAVFRSGGPSSTNTARSLRENYRIRRTRLGFGNAIPFALRRLLSVEYFKLRKRVGQALLGESRYRNLKRARHLGKPAP
jgi:glycosyltransferase involved in cell wall biosynthesis